MCPKNHAFLTRVETGVRMKGQIQVLEGRRRGETFGSTSQQL